MNYSKSRTMCVNYVCVLDLCVQEVCVSFFPFLSLCACVSNIDLFFLFDVPPLVVCVEVSFVSTG